MNRLRDRIRSLMPPCVPWALLLLTAFAIRIPYAGRALWADETFSYCMASGHSIESLPTRASDYSDPAGKTPAGALLRYAQPEGHISGILSATARSDTSPPLYYLLLRAWWLFAGDSAFAARLLSILFCVLAVWLVTLAGMVFSRPAGWIAGLLLAVSPYAVDVPSEARMYGLLLLEAAAATLCSLQLLRAPRTRLWVAWVCVSVAGLYTHYLFFAVFAAQALCLAGDAWRRGDRRSVVLRLGAAAFAAACFLPWAPALVAQFSEPRLTSSWLRADIPASAVLAEWSGNIGGVLTGSRHSWFFSAAVVVAFVAILALRGSWRRPEYLLVAATAVIPLICVPALDLARGTYQVTQLRYLGLAAPSLALGLAIAIGLAPVIVRWTAVAAVCAYLTAGSVHLMNWRMRNWEPFDAVARFVNHRKPGTDIVLVRSIPSGVFALCRHLHPATPVACVTEDIAPHKIPAVAESRIGEPVSWDLWVVVAHADWSPSFRAGTGSLLDWCAANYRLEQKKTFGEAEGVIQVYRFAVKTPAR